MGFWNLEKYMVKETSLEQLRIQKRMKYTYQTRPFSHEDISRVLSLRATRCNPKCKTDISSVSSYPLLPDKEQGHTADKSD